MKFKHVIILKQTSAIATMMLPKRYSEIFIARLTRLHFSVIFPSAKIAHVMGRKGWEGLRIQEKRKRLHYVRSLKAIAEVDKG